MQFTQLKIQVLDIPGLKIPNNFYVQDNWIALTEWIKPVIDKCYKNFP